MPNIKNAKAFSKKLAKFLSKHPELYDKIKGRIETLASDPHALHLENHKLRGTLKDYYAFTISADCRIIFDVDPTDGAYILLNIGSHDDVY